MLLPTTRTFDGSESRSEVPLKLLTFSNRTPGLRVLRMGGGSDGEQEAEERAEGSSACSG